VALLMVEVLASVALHELVAVPLGPVFAHAARQVIEALQVSEVDVVSVAGGGGVPGHGAAPGCGCRGHRRSGRGRRGGRVRLTESRGTVKLRPFGRSWDVHEVIEVPLEVLEVPALLVPWIGNWLGRRMGSRYPRGRGFATRP